MAWRKRRGHIQRQGTGSGLEEAPRAHAASNDLDWPGGSAAGIFSVKRRRLGTDGAARVAAPAHQVGAWGIGSVGIRRVGRGAVAGPRAASDMWASAAAARALDESRCGSSGGRPGLTQVPNRMPVSVCLGQCDGGGFARHP